MTDFPTALDWLNQFEGPHTSIAAMVYRGKALDPDALENDRVEAFNRWLEVAEASADPLEHAEVRVLRAAFNFSLGNYAIAHIELASALDRYRQLSAGHEQAVVEWMLGLIEWKLQLNIEAVNNWRAARNEFIQLEQTHQADGDLGRAEWYANQAKEMGGLLACTPEEAYMWNRGLNFFEGTTPGGVQENIRLRLETAARDGDNPQANQLIDRLMQLSRSQNQSLEKGEVFLECGFWKYQIGEMEAASDYLKQAIQFHHPDSLHQALARWILGAIQWKDQRLAEKAIQNWTICQHTFAMLCEQANWSKDLELLKWYREKLEQMGQAFNRKVGG